MSKKHNNAIGPQVRERKGYTNSNTAINLLLVAFIFIFGLMGSTQHFAYSFQYNELLGQNWNYLYWPWQIINWYFQFGDEQPTAFRASGGVGIVVVAIGFCVVIIQRQLSANTSKPNHYLHGSARWAEKKDLQKAGLLGDDGVYVGGWLDKRNKLHYLRHSGPEHILTYAPTRSGKGVGLVIPTLLSWTKSSVITDLKGELWQLTSGWRQQYANNKVIKFEPAALEGSAGWNPLSEIRIGTEYEVGDVQNLATLLVDPDGKGLKDHWQKTSQSLLVGVILHALYVAKNTNTIATFSSIDKMWSDPEREVSELWLEMTQYKHANNENHPVVGSSGRDMMDRPEEEAGSVLSTAKSYLTLYRDPVVARNTEKSDFCIKDLMNHDQPVSLYIVTQPNDKARLRPLVRVMVNMIIRFLADKLEFDGGKPKQSFKHKLLMMLDEFPSLGKLEILQESLAFLAGYGIKCYLICQDINQLKSRETGYGHDETVTSACHVQNAYPPNRIETATHLSKLTGQTTVVKESITISGKRVSAMQSNVSKTQHETQRALLTEDECLRMKGPEKTAEGLIKEAGDMIISVSNCPAIYGKQLLFFNDPSFLARSKIPAPKQSDVIRGRIKSQFKEVVIDE